MTSPAKAIVVSAGAPGPVTVRTSAVLVEETDGVVTRRHSPRAPWQERWPRRWRLPARANDNPARQAAYPLTGGLSVIQLSAAAGVPGVGIRGVKHGCFAPRAVLTAECQ